MFTWLKKKQIPRRIYLDNAASTPLDPRVKAAMEPYWSDLYGNPGSIHKEGVVAHRAVEDARERIAACLGALPDEILFTSGGTEANHLAVRGLAQSANAEEVFITSEIEHPSVLENIRALERAGQQTVLLPVDSEGCVDLGSLREALKQKVMLVSVMYVNNEVGTIQPVRDIAKQIRTARKEHQTKTPYFHSDASQAPLYLPTNVQKLGVDLMTLDGQKMYGPKGVGLLYKRRGVPLKAVSFGGEQEFGIRPGTENVPLIVGFAKALEIACEEQEGEQERLTKLQIYFFEKLRRDIPHAIVNGNTEERIPNNINISLPGVDSEFAVLWLDARGIACGSRSACTSKTYENSHVVQAMGGSEGVATSTLRFSMGKGTQKSDLDRTIQILKTVPQKLTK